MNCPVCGDKIPQGKAKCLRCGYECKSVATVKQDENKEEETDETRGGADESYGIEVAKLAGVPDMVIDRAKEIVEQLTDNDIIEKIQNITVDVRGDGKTRKQPRLDEVDLAQMSLFDTVTDEDVIKELMEVEVNTMSPLDALNTLYRLQNKLKNRWQGEKKI